MLCLIIYGQIPKQLKDCGLYVRNNGIFVPPCQYVEGALEYFAEDKTDEMLKFMLSSSNTKAVAFELFVTRGFKYTDTLRYVTGPRSGEEFIQVNVKRQIKQQRGVPLQKIEPETLVICYPNHPAVDLIVYTKQEVLIFVQISISAYKNHGSKRDHIFTQPMETQKDLSVYQYYTSLAVTRNNEPKWKNAKNHTQKTFLQDTCYLYVSCAPLEAQGHFGGIKLIAAEHLDCFGRIGASYFKNA